VNSQPSAWSGAAGVRRFKVVELDVTIGIQGETGLWVMWLGDRLIPSDEWKHPDAVRNDTQAAVPLAGGVLVPGSTYHRVFRFDGLWMNSDQKIALCIDPTVGGGFYQMSIHGMYIMAD